MTVYVLILTILTAHGPYHREFVARSFRHCIAAGVDVKSHYDMRFEEPVSVKCEKRKKVVTTKHPLIRPLANKGFYN